MVSLRKIAECLGLSGGFSVLHDFLGYRTLISRFGMSRISLLLQVQLLQNRYVNLNIIRVGVDVFEINDDRKIDSAIKRTRDIFAAVNLGVGRIDHYGITRDDVNYAHIINSDAEAVALTASWTFPNDSVDVFIVKNSWAGSKGEDTQGYAIVDGPCNKDAAGVMTGVVVALRGVSPILMGNNLAHELGHYFGLPHVCNLASDPAAPDPCLTGSCQPQHQTSLMFPCIGRTNSINISNEEFQRIYRHCFFNGGCAGS